LGKIKTNTKESFEKEVLLPSLIRGGWRKIVSLTYSSPVLEKKHSLASQLEEVLSTHYLSINDIVTETLPQVVKVGGNLTVSF